MSKSNFTLFINPKFTCKLDGGPTLWCTGQVLLCKDKDGNFVLDEAEVVDIDKITLMGVEIEDYKGRKNCVEHFKTMGIDLWDIAIKELDELIAMSGDVKQFVLDQTGITLP